MLYSVSGKFVLKSGEFAVVDAGGLGLKIFTNQRTLDSLPQSGSEVKFFSYLYLREDSIELYGFLKPEELRFFELLNMVAGVGPKSALAILEISGINELAAAIKENRPDLLTRASGIGRKTAERIILELKNKITAADSGKTIEKMESDTDIIEALIKLGYRRDQAKSALQKVDEKIISLEERLKAALKILSGKR